MAKRGNPNCCKPAPFVSSKTLSAFEHVVDALRLICSIGSRILRCLGQKRRAERVYF